MTDEEDDTFELKDPLIINEHIFSVSGSWPLRRIYWRYVLALITMGVHICMQVWDLYDWWGDINRMVDNVVVTLITIASYISLIVLPVDKNLKNMLTTMKREIKGNTLFANKDEKQLYRSYNSVSYFYTKYGNITTASIAVAIMIHPMIDAIKLQHSHAENSTPFRLLPIRSHVFFEYTDIRVYCVLYAYQCAMLYGALFHTNEISLLVNLVLHLCGKLAILSYRIRHIRTKSTSEFNVAIKTAVTKHRELTQVSYNLSATFEVILLWEIVQTNLRVALSMYMATINLHKDTVAVCYFFVMFVGLSGLLYLHSYIGEQLMYESIKVGDSYYDINWVEITNENRRTLLICMINGQKMLRVTAGKCYTFSLFGYTGIMKTAFAFVSMLQAMI